MPALLVVLAAICILSGCGKSVKDSAAPVMSESSSGSADVNASDVSAFTDADTGARQVAERKVIRQASLALVVSDLEKAAADLQELAQSYGGYVESAEVRNLERTSRGSITIMVASEKLDQAIDAIEKLGRVERKSITGRDVTGEYYDTATRKANLAVHEKRLLELYDRASTIQEMLDIENELSRVRGEIESLTTRIQVLDKLTSLSKIKIDLESSKAIKSSSGIEVPSFAERIKTAWQSAVGGLTGLLQGMVLLVVYILPFSPIIAVVLYLIYRRWKKGRRAGKNNE